MPLNEGSHSSKFNVLTYFSILFIRTKILFCEQNSFISDLCILILLSVFTDQDKNCWKTIPLQT